MGKRYEYKVKIANSTRPPMTLSGEPVDAWSHATAVEHCRVKLASWPAGTVAEVERREATHTRQSGHDFGPWLPHRAYVVGADGIVRRTDR